MMKLRKTQWRDEYGHPTWGLLFVAYSSTLAVTYALFVGAIYLLEALR